MYPANEGDAFLISFGNNQSCNLLIDMGLKKTYQNSIKPDLIKLKHNGKHIDLLVVTHIDNDHILGAIEFVKENGADSKIVEVKEVWHNSYRHLQFAEKKPISLNTDETSILNQIKNQNSPKTIKNGLSEVTIDEGLNLASLLYKYKYSWNLAFEGKAITKQNQVIVVSPDISIRVISPNIRKLNKLAKKWKERLESEKYNFTLNEDELFDDAFEFFMLYSDHDSEIQEISGNDDVSTYEELLQIKGKDNSLTNGSSIAFIIEYRDKQLLFLGDAHEDIIYEELLYLKNSGYKLDFEIVKVSHHGSNNNISNRMLEIISSKRFLISTNGKRSHPDITTIAKITASSENIEIIVNYPHEKIEIFRNSLKENQNQFKLITTCEIIIE